MGNILKKFKWGDFVIISIVLLLAAGLAIMLWATSSGGVLYAEIWRDGVLVERVALHEGTSRTIDLDGHNTIILKGMTAKMLSADCRDQVCVHTGTLSYSGQTAVCLPNKVILKLNGGESGVDAVAS